MAQQTTFGNQGLAYPGLLYGLAGSHRTLTAVNDLGAVRQVDTITVATAVGTLTTYSLTVDGYLISFSTASASKTVIRDGLIAAARAILNFEATVAFQPSSTDKITITSLVIGTGFTTAESDANLTLANTVANVAQVEIPFGRGVVRRRTLASTLLTVAAVNSTAYAIVIDGVTVGYTSDASATTAEITQGLVDELGRLMEEGGSLDHLRGLIYAVQGTDTLTIYKVNPGLAITVSEADANITLANTTTSVPTNATDKSAKLPSLEVEAGLFLGVVQRIHSNVNPLNPQASYPAAAVAFGQDMSVTYSGPIWVEVTGAVAAGDKAYCYHSGATVVGKFINGPTSGTAFPVPGQFRTSTTGAGYAVLELNLA